MREDILAQHRHINRSYYVDIVPVAVQDNPGDDAGPDTLSQLPGQGYCVISSLISELRIAAMLAKPPRFHQPTELTAGFRRPSGCSRQANCLTGVVWEHYPLCTVRLRHLAPPRTPWGFSLFVATNSVSVPNINVYRVVLGQSQFLRSLERRRRNPFGQPRNVIAIVCSDGVLPRPNRWLHVQPRRHGSGAGG